MALAFILAIILYTSVKPFMQTVKALRFDLSTLNVLIVVASVRNLWPG